MLANDGLLFKVGEDAVSIGTFGLGLLDLWRDPTRRLALDRVSSTGPD